MQSSKRPETIKVQMVPVPSTFSFILGQFLCSTRKLLMDWSKTNMNVSRVTLKCLSIFYIGISVLWSVLGTTQSNLYLRNPWQFSISEILPVLFIENLYMKKGSQKAYRQQLRWYKLFIATNEFRWGLNFVQFLNNFYCIYKRNHLDVCFLFFGSKYIHFQRVHSKSS